MDERAWNIRDLFRKAEHALLACDTTAASNLYTKAANQLDAMSKETKDNVERAELRTQAAIANYEAGRYREALPLFDHIDFNLLNKKWQGMHTHYRKMTVVKMGYGWTQQRANEIQRAFAAQKWNKLLRYLADSPYVIPAPLMATMRAAACRGGGDEETAKLFEEDAAKLNKQLH